MDLEITDFDVDLCILDKFDLDADFSHVDLPFEMVLAVVEESFIERPKLDLDLDDDFANDFERKFPFERVLLDTDFALRTLPDCSCIILDLL